MHSIKLCEYRMVIKFDKDPLAIEQNNYTTKIVNVYIVYNPDAWPRYPTNNLIVQVFGVLIMTVLEMLLFSTLIIVHHLILTIFE